ncbi:LexA-binding, inner membrane-associated putative hydrolase [anaerobic digester metagenome]
MLVFCHIMAGAAIGLLWGRAGAVRPLLSAGMIGAILPDLIDKPIGHLLLGGTLDNGRILSHSLGFFFAVFVIGMLLFRQRHPFLGPVLALGVLSHQLLDAMWRDPAAWFYPLLGPFTSGEYPDYFLHGIIAELSSPAEWLFGVTLLALTLVIYRPRVASLADLRPAAGCLLPCLGTLVGLLGLFTLVAASLGLSNPCTQIVLPGDQFLLGMAAIVESAIILEGVPDNPGPGE